MKFIRRRYQKWKLKLRGQDTYIGYDCVCWFASLRWTRTPGKRWHRQNVFFQETKNYSIVDFCWIPSPHITVTNSKRVKKILCIRTSKLHVSHPQRTENWLELGDTKIQSAKKQWAFLPSATFDRAISQTKPKRARKSTKNQPIILCNNLTLPFHCSYCTTTISTFQWHIFHTQKIKYNKKNVSSIHHKWPIFFLQIKKKKSSREIKHSVI